MRIRSRAIADWLRDRLGLIRHLIRYFVDAVMWLPDEVAIYRQFTRDAKRRRREEALRSDLSRALDADPYSRDD